MKIEDLKTYLINDWLIVEIITDSGITGIGQGTFWGQPKATEQVIQEFKDYLVGSNPMQTDYHYQYLIYQHLGYKYHRQLKYYHQPC